MKLLMENWKKFLLKESDDIEELLDAYLDNPIDFTIPSTIAIHPKMIKARRKVFSPHVAKCMASHGKRPAVGALDLSPSSPANLAMNNALEATKEKERELETIIAKLNKMGAAAQNQAERDKLIKTPEWLRLATELERLQNEIEAAKPDERELGRQQGANIHAQLMDTMALATGPCGFWVGKDTANRNHWKRTTAENALGTLESDWRREWERNPERQRERSEERRKRDEERRAERGSSMMATPAGSRLDKYRGSK